MESSVPWRWPTCSGDREVWTSLRAELLSNSTPVAHKAAAHRLKKLIAEACADLLDLTIAPTPQFWLDYFELFDILDEKQSHIVQPVLQNKIQIFNRLRVTHGCDAVDDDPSTTADDLTDLCNWFLIILVKMLHHDNRDIVKEGFLRFLSLGEENWEKSSNIKDLLLNFMKDQIFPKIRDHIGWVHPEAEDYMETAKKFGLFLRNVYCPSTGVDYEDEAVELNSELQILLVILNFMMEDGKCRSPAVALFVVKAMRCGLRDRDDGDLLLSSNDEYMSNSWLALEEIFLLMGKTLTQGLTSVDPFIRREIERILINTLISCVIPILQALFDQINSKIMINLELSRSRVMYNVLTICGAVPLKTLINHGTSNSINVWSWIHEKCLKFLPTVDGFLRFQELSGLQLKGYIRVAWLGSGRSDTSYNIFDVLCKELQSNCDLGQHFILLSETLAEYQALCCGDSKQLQHCIQIEQEILHNLTFLSTIDDQAIFVRQVHSLELLKVLLKSDYTSSVMCETLTLHANKFFADLTHNSSDYITSSTYYEFLAWKFISVLPLFVIQDLENNCVPHVINLFLRDSSLSVTNWVINDTDLRTGFFITKFNSFADFLTNSKESKKETRTQEQHDSDISILINVISYIFDNMEKAGFGGVTSAVRCVRAMLDFTLRRNDDQAIFIKICQDHCANSLLKNFSSLAWNLMFEVKRTESFSPAFDEFTLLISHPCFIGQGILTPFSSKIFKESETLIGLPCALVQSLLYSTNNYWEILKYEERFESSMLQEIVKVSLEASLSGVPLPKNYRVIFGLWRYLLKNGQDDSACESINNCIFTKSSMVRLTAIQILQTILGNLQSGILKTKILEQVLCYLLDKNDGGAKKHYFRNSAQHRKKLKLLQILLMLQPLFNREQNVTILDRLLALLSEDSPQPSIRYLTEWIVVRVLAKDKTTWDSFFMKCIQFWTKRIGFGTHFSSICLHTISMLLHHVDVSHQDFLEKALFYLSQLVLGHHVTVRAYSQVCFQRIFESVRPLEIFSELVRKFEIMYISLQGAEKFCVGTSAKILEGISNDFYIQFFNPVTHYTKDVIFIHLPQISEVASDEIPTENCLSKSGMNVMMDECCISAKPSSSKELKELYLKYELTVWHMKTTLVSGREIGEQLQNIRLEATETPTLANFQRKINPWKTLCVSETLMDSMNEKLTVKKRAAMEDGLIVVASLVDRIPNLGGLCRSCEIFGISKYVMPSLKILDDQQFQNLAVSSHNWVDITEVTPKDLPSFLATYKAKGYVILGVEQAQKTTRLNDFKFPKKSLLVLGHEKFGIPSNILHLVDHCLEIPQLGFIRSLNVHVTGALCIWEYSTQHALK